MKNLFEIVGRVLLLAVICYFTIYFIGGIWFLGSSSLSVDNFFADVLIKQSSFLIVALTAFFLVKKYKLKTGQLINLKHFSFSFAFTVILYLVFAWILQLINVLELNRYTFSEENIFHILLFCFFPALFISIGEEFLFRYFLLRKFNDFLNPAVAVLLSSLVFAIGHFSFELHSFIFLFVFGLFVSIIYINTHSLSIVIGIHTAWNFTQYLLYPDSSEFTYIGDRLFKAGKVNQLIYDWSETTLLLILILIFFIYSLKQTNGTRTKRIKPTNYGTEKAKQKTKT